MTLAKYRNRLPQLDGRILLTDGGLETTLIFHDQVDLPYFAAFDLLRTLTGRERLKTYYSRYAALARELQTGFALDTPTWRASHDWGVLLGYSQEALAAANREAVELMFEVRETFETPNSPFVISGDIGPRGDGYHPGSMMTASQSEAYHAAQITVLAEAGVDMLTALTMTDAKEAIGIVRAARSAGLPVAISFTVETDGRLPSGQLLADAISEVDSETGSAPAYFMLNCAHPTHFLATVANGSDWSNRIRGLRANASRMSHEELDNAEELDDGDPIELGQQYGELMQFLPQLVVFGGCCGTDHRHIEAIGRSCCHKQAA